MWEGGHPRGLQSLLGSQIMELERGLWEMLCPLHLRPGFRILRSCKSLGSLEPGVRELCGRPKFLGPSTVFPQLLTPLETTLGHSHRCPVLGCLPSWGSVWSLMRLTLESEPCGGGGRAPGDQAGPRGKGEEKLADRPGDTGSVSTDLHTVGGRWPRWRGQLAQSPFYPWALCLEEPLAPSFQRWYPPAQGT